MRTSVASFLLGTSRSRILALLYGDPQREFYLREVAETLKASPGLVSRELGALTKHDLLVRRSHGKHVYFRANRKHPVFAELAGLLAKTSGIYARLRETLMPLRDRMRFAFVFGSFAKHQERSGSDIDLAIVGTVTLDDVLQCVGPLEKELGREIAPVIFSEEEFLEKRSSENHFVSALVRGEMVMLKGEQDELRGLGQLRLGTQRADIEG